MTDTHTIPKPQFAFRQNNVVVIDKQNWLVQQRLVTGQWLLVDMATGETRFITDDEIACQQSEGRFHLHPSSSKREAGPEPLSPVVVGDAGHTSNNRKHAYVEACQGLPRSRNAMRPAIAAVANMRSEEAPGFTTVVLWINEYEQWGSTHGTAAYADRHDLKGSRGSRLPPALERALQLGVDAWLQLQNGDLAYAVVEAEVRRLDEEESHLIDKPSLPACYLDNRGRLIPPSKRTLYRRCKSLNRLTVDIAHFGEGRARKFGRTWATRELPDRPYQEVEVDHCTLDITLVDAGGLIVGRPDLVCFRDRATTMVLGVGIGFDAPSYASFMEGLRHAIYPKDMSDYPGIKNPWPCFGSIETLIIDGALHFLGDSIDNAGRELGFNRQLCPPREPWMKGGIERFFGTMGMGLVHNLAGTTLSNVADRQEREHLSGPALTLPEFKHLLMKWICDVYHADITKALGPVRGFGAQPLKTWAEKAQSFVTPSLPHPDIFISLAGQVSFRTVQKDGIVLDYIKYEDPTLSQLLHHPKHRRRSSEGGASRYKVLRDPQDLSFITVIDPYRNVPLRVPATLGHRKYAERLTLHQHQVIIANARARNREIDHDALVQAKSGLAALSMRILNHPGRRGVEKAVARFIGADLARRHRSKLIPAPKMEEAVSGAGLLVSRSIADQPSRPRNAMAPQIDEDDDLQVLRGHKTLKFHVLDNGAPL